VLLIIGLGSLAAIAAVAALALALLTSRRNKSQPPTTRAAQVTPAPNSSPDSHTDPEPGGLLSGAPILNSSQEMVAYDLVLPQADLADEALSSTAVAQFARQLLDALHTLGLERLGNRRVHVPIPHDILRSGYVELLPANYVVLTIAPDEEPWLLDRCKELAAAGYQLSVDLGSASPSVEFLSLCRYARVSVQDADIDALRERVRGLRRHTRLIATGVFSLVPGQQCILDPQIQSRQVAFQFGQLFLSHLRQFLIVGL
jgi:hypothetical protein